MRLKITKKNQNGFTLTPAMFILALLMIAGTTFLLYINSVGKTARKIESSQIAKYSAETGIYQLKSQLAKLNVRDPVSNKVMNQWYRAKKLDGTCCLFNSTATIETDRTPDNTARVSDYISLKENSNNLSSAITSQYRITIEDGSKLGVAGTDPTATGSLIAGTDRYGNKIWSNSTDKNIFINEGVSRFGVRVDGYTVDSSGNKLPGSQSIYAVLDVPQTSNIDAIKTWSEKSPSNYMLSSNGLETDSFNPLNDRRLTLLSNMIITGPIHTNDRLDFTWNGNFDIANTAKPENSQINRNYTITATRFSGANTWDPNPPMVSGIYHEIGRPANEIVIYGLNFSPVPGNNDVRFPPTNIPALGVTPEVAAAPYNTTCMKLRVLMPAGVTSGDLYIATTESFAATYFNFDFTKPLIDKSVDVVPPSVKTSAPANPAPMRALGIMQLSEPGFLSDKVYQSFYDYNMASYDSPSTPELDHTPYVDWTPAGDEPVAGKNYYVTFITDKNMPHRKIKVYGKMTYSGSFPKMYYIHSHKAPGTSYYPWTKTHSHLGGIFGMPGVDLLDAVKPDSYFVPISGIYDWMTYHRHEISSALLTSGFSDPDDYFFHWHNTTFKPSTDTVKISPLLAPNNVNFYTQREYANQVLKLTQGKSLNRNASNQLEDLSKFNDDRQNGFYDATTSGNQVDFRSVYFGNDLKYSIGPLMNSYVLSTGELSPKVIYVNDNKLSLDYMKVSSTVIDTNYKIYRYIEIPHNGSSLSGDEKEILACGVIFVKEGKVLIGGGTYNGVVDGTDYMYGISAFDSKKYGQNTIIDGRLSIVSYSEQKPSNYDTDNPGDVIITGNIIYKNKIFPYKDEFISKNFDFGNYNGFRQYPYNYNVTSSTWPADINWITSDLNGRPHANLVLPDKADSLGLFASNDIKIPVNHYHQPSSKEDHYTNSFDEATTDCPCKDELEIHGQLIAGHKITQSKISSGITSKNDRLIMYGSFYSYEPPNLSYFDGGDPTKPEEEGTGRLYLFDKTLSDSPVIGAPSFPKDSSYSSSNQIIVGTDLPRVVPGTWKQVTDGS